ncbi:MAG: nucleotidyltransferase domain-containing protein [Chloroflexi bacterium]|nr:nucleotidyltransferase domain-containing protein [Chloroflexota bacterium]MBP8058581.1 nucleotidyltransferase domain-containing protein [Chloroflexota bacterium]
MWNKSASQPYREYHRQREVAQLARREALRQEKLAAAQIAISALAPQFPALERVYLFGSIVQCGRFTRHSDIDVAVVGGEPAIHTQFWRLLEQQLHWNIDVRPCLDPIQATVYREGICAYVRESNHSIP